MADYRIPTPGEVFEGKYRIEGVLGRGGMGEVYRARDIRIEREVAVKVLPASVAGDRERLRRFEKEARAAGALSHPNIVALYDIGYHDGAPYIVQELRLPRIGRAADGAREAALVGWGVA